MSKPWHRALTTSLMMILASLAGCLDAEDVGGEPTDAYGTVVVSTYHIAELVSAVGGDLVNVEMISTTNIPVHDYEPSAQDIIRLQGADVFLYHGLGLEPWVEDIIDTMGADAPTASATHAMPSGEETLDFESILIGDLCRYLSSPSTTDVHPLAEDAEEADELHAEVGAYNLAMPEHDEDEHDEHDEGEHEEDDHHEDEHGEEEHDEHDHGDDGLVEPEETMSLTDSECPAGTTVSIYHLEEGEYVLEFETEDLESFTMALSAMGGGHAHHDHGEDEHDEHDEHEDDMSAADVLALFDTDGDDHLSLQEFLDGMESMEDDEDDHDHGEDSIETHDDNETSEHGDEHDDLEHEIESAMFEYLFNEADADGDALLDLAELEELEHIMEEMDDDIGLKMMMAVYMSVFDEDDNGTLSVEEFTEMMDAMMSMEDDEEHGHGDEGHDEEEGDVWNEVYDHCDDEEDALSSYFCWNDEWDEDGDGTPEDSNSYWNYECQQLADGSWECTTDHINYYDRCEYEDVNYYECWLDEWDTDNNGSYDLGSDGYMDDECEQLTDGRWACEHSEDDHDDEDMTEYYEMMFTMLDANEDGSLDMDELMSLADMMDDEHEEGAGFIHLHVEREGEYGIALPEGVSLHVLTEEDHEGHDHGHDEEEGEHHDEEDDHHDEEDEHHDEEDDHHDDHGDEDDLNFDPHSWLNPMAFSAQIDVVLDVLSTAFPDGAEAFEANANAYKAELLALDGEFEAAFGDNGTCSANTVAANHNAYAYLASAYDLEFVTVHGLDPEGEPSAEDIAEVVERVAEDGITVLFVEEYTDEAAVASLVQQTVSNDMPEGLTVLTLYTMELAPMNSDDDYMSLMTKNLENLKIGLGC